MTKTWSGSSGGSEGNRAAFIDLVKESNQPLGLVAYEAGQPVDWSAVGPRSRYDRMLRSPTLKSRDRSEDDTVWLMPCFYIRKESRRNGVARSLLEAAVELAREQDVSAIEGFPLAGDRLRSEGTDFQTGVEPLFESCGFHAIHRPSKNLVIMRLDLR